MLKFPEPHWTLEEGLSLIRSIQPITKQFGYHICLGGGVLNKGMSFKDLDLYFLPLDSEEIVKDEENLLKWLSMLWGDYKKIGSEDYPEQEESSSYKKKIKFDFCGLRIDVFVL